MMIDFKAIHWPLVLLVFVLTVVCEYRRLKVSCTGERVVRVAEIAAASIFLGFFPNIMRPSWSDAVVIGLTVVYLRLEVILGNLLGRWANRLETSLVAYKYLAGLEDAGKLGLLWNWLKFKWSKEAPLYVGRTTNVFVGIRKKRTPK